MIAKDDAKTPHNDSKPNQNATPRPPNSRPKSLKSQYADIHWSKTNLVFYEVIVPSEKYIRKIEDYYTASYHIHDYQQQYVEDETKNESPKKDSKEATMTNW